MSHFVRILHERDMGDRTGAVVDKTNLVSVLDIGPGTDGGKKIRKIY